MWSSISSRRLLVRSGTRIARRKAGVHMAEPVLGESLRGLLRGILMDLRTLIREEIALARVEIREQAGRAKAAALSFGIAAAALAFGGIFLLVAVALGIASLLGWPAWTGFLIVAVLLCIGGFFTLSSGRKQLASVHAVPGETVTTLK